MFCTDCGTEYNEGLYCSKCGKETKQDINKQETKFENTSNESIIIEPVLKEETLSWEEINNGISFKAEIVGASEYFMKEEKIDVVCYPDKIFFNDNFILLKDKIFDIKLFLKIKNKNNLIFADKNIYLRALAGGGVGLVLSGLFGNAIISGVMSVILFPSGILLGALSSIPVKAINNNENQKFIYLCIKYFNKEEFLKTILLDITESKGIDKKIKLFLEKFPMKMQDKNIEL